MPRIATISGRAEFNYTGNCQSGFTIEYESAPNIFVSSLLIKHIRSFFSGQALPGGFNVSSPSGFGLWLQENTEFTSRNGSHIAAVMAHENLIEYFKDGNTIFLVFPIN